MRKLSVAVGVATLTTIVSAVACNSHKNTSESKDLVTDLNSAAGQIYYYFVQTPDIYRGTCAPDLPMLKDNCLQDLRKADYGTFKTKVASDIETSIQTLSSKIAALKNTDKTLNTQLIDSDKRVQVLTGELSTLDASLADRKSAVTKKEQSIAQYQTNIDQVKTQLQSDPNNTDLQGLQAQLISEQAALKSQRDALNAEIAATEAAANAAAKRSEKASLESARPALVQKIADNKAQLDASRAQRDLANEEKGLLSEVLTKLESGGIGHRILSGNSLNEDLKPFVVRFAQYFNGNPATLPTPVATPGSGASTPVPTPAPVAADHRLSEAGILEVMYQGQWRGVCDDNFSENAGRVACRAMGKSFAGFTAGASVSSGNFWLDDVVCTGTENSLFSCQHQPVGSHNCVANEGVKLVCQ